MIHVEDRGRVRVVAMEHGKVNALDVELLQGLTGAFESAGRAGTRAVVLTGTGGSFSAGVDLWRILDGGRDYIERFLPQLESCLSTLFDFPRPVVAAVNGHAIAGGCILACGCDRRFMAAGRGRVGVPELQVGVPFPMLALEMLRAATSDVVAAELAFTGATYGPEEALRRGLVDAILEPDVLLARACEQADRLAAIPPAAFALAKRQLRQPVRERCDRLAAAFDADVLRAWCDPASAASIRTYLDRTLSKGG